MISRTTIGCSFGGVVRYQFEGRKQQPSDKQAEVLAAVGVRADSAAHMTADFNRGRQLNPNLGQAVWHTSLSFNPDDAARLDSATMLAVAEGYVRKMGLDQTQYVIIRHHDQPDNQHLHIIANRVGDDGQTIKDGQNFYRSKQALKELIQEHGLTPPQGLRVAKQHPAQLQGAELTKHELRQTLHQALATATDRPALLATLQAQQISAREFTNKAGEVTGISFEKDGTVFKGSQLGRQYSMAGITQQLEANSQAQQPAQEQLPIHAQLPAPTVLASQSAFQVAELPQAKLAQFGWSLTRLAENGQLQRLLDGAPTDVLAMQFNDEQVPGNAPISFEGQFVLARQENGAVEVKLALPRQPAAPLALAIVRGQGELVAAPAPAMLEQTPVAAKFPTLPEKPASKPTLPRKKRGPKR